MGPDGGGTTGFPLVRQGRLRNYLCHKASEAPANQPFSASNKEMRQRDKIDLGISPKTFKESPEPL
jgi:hypothetical protein